MDLRELKIQFLNAKIVTDDVKVMFRTPNCSAYYDCNSHIAKYNGDNVLVIDLIDKIEPIFKVGDVVINSSRLYPNVKCTITAIDKEKQCYYFKEVTGVTYFKDQDKLILVNDEEVRPPVEDSIKLDEFNARLAKNNVLTANLEHHAIIRNLTNIINRASKIGRVCHNFIIPCVTKTDKSGVYYEEAEICGIIRWHFTNLGFTVKDKFDDKNNCTEFFISW